MKKLMCIAVLALTLTGCGKTEDRYASLLNDYTEAVKDAKTPEDAQKVSEEYGEKITKFEKSHEEELKEIAKDPKRVAVIQKAYEQMMQTVIEKGTSFGGDVPNVEE